MPAWCCELTNDDLIKHCSPAVLQVASERMLSNAIRSTGMAKEEWSCTAEWMAFPHIYINSNGFKVVVMLKAA